MADGNLLTVPQVAAFFDLPTWKIRRIVDSAGVHVPRAGQYRLIERSLLPTIAAELERQTQARKDREGVKI